MKAGVEAEAGQALVGPQEGFLVNITGVFRAAQEVHGAAQDTLVVSAHQALEGVMIAFLGGPDQSRFVK